MIVGRNGDCGWPLSFAKALSDVVMCIVIAAVMVLAIAVFILDFQRFEEYATLYGSQKKDRKVLKRAAVCIQI